MNKICLRIEQSPDGRYFLGKFRTKRPITPREAHRLARVIDAAAEAATSKESDHLSGLINNADPVNTSLIDEDVYEFDDVDSYDPIPMADLLDDVRAVALSRCCSPTDPSMRSKNKIIDVRHDYDSVTTVSTCDLSAWSKDSSHKPDMVVVWSSCELESREAERHRRGLTEDEHLPPQAYVKLQEFSRDDAEMLLRGMKAAWPDLNY